MSKTWTCPHGHEWETDDDQDFSADNLSANCPICKRRLPTLALRVAEIAKLNQKHLQEVLRDAPETVLGVHLPGFEIQGELGRGGMAVVYKARQIRLDRIVAIKMLHPGRWANPKHLARFREEARVLARLQHPNIVQIFEVSEADGHSFFTMEYVAGGTLAKTLDDKPIVARLAASMVHILAQTVHGAHQAGVLHRDLKPGNVLVTQDGVLKISDFGLAKLTESDSHLTDSGDVLGTPSYMAPEQAAHKPEEVGTGADVYALGSILYEMLTGRPPFLADTPVATVLQLLHDEPVPPSQLHSSVPLDLETICLKCLEKTPRKRYRSAEALADDLGRFLDGAPILARPTSTRERVWKWIKRHPAWAVSVAVSCAAALAFVTELLVSNVRLQRERDHALAMEKLASESQARAEGGQAEARRQFDLARRSLYALQLSRIAAVPEGKFGTGVEMLAETRRCPLDLRDLTWDIFYGRCQRQQLERKPQDQQVNALALSPDGKVLASALGTGKEPGTIRLWDLSSDREIKKLQGHKNLIVALAFAGDGQTLVSAGQDSQTLIWDWGSGRVVRTLNHAAPIDALALSADGSRLATAGDDRLTKVWEVATGTQVAVLKGHTAPVWSVAWSPDGRTLASGSADTTVKLWETDGWRERATLQGHMAGVSALAFSRQGTTLASADAAPRRGDVWLWDAESARPRGAISGHTAGITCLTFTPDDRALLAGDADGTVRFLDALTGQERATFKEHGKRVSGLAVTPNGKLLASGSADQTVLLWPAARNHDLFATLEGHAGPVTCVAFAPNQTMLATASADRSVKLWSMKTGQEEATLEGHDHWVWAVDFSSDGARLASADAAGVVKIWDTGTRKEILTLKGHGDTVRALAFSPDGKTLATACNDRNARIWDVASGEVVSVFRNAGQVTAVAWSADGNTLAAGVAHYNQPSEVKCWDIASNRETLSWPGFAGKITGISFSPNGKLLAAASEGWTLRLWDLEQQRERLAAQGGGLPRFSPDSNTLAVTAAGQTVKLLDTSGRERLTIPAHRDVITSLTFSPDGRLLATASWDQTARLWELPK